MQEISREWLDERFRNIDSLFADNKCDHDKIIIQTTKTNGTVRKLQLWQAYMTGGLALLGFVLGVLLASLKFII